MSIQAKLLIDDLEVNILDFNFTINRKSLNNVTPTNLPVFKGINMVIESRKDLNLSSWSFSKNETKQLQVHIYSRINNGKIRKLYLFDCHLVNWNTKFSSVSNEPMHETLGISCGGVKDSNSDTEYSAYWRVTFDKEDVEATSTEKDVEKKVVNYQLTDADGYELDEYEVGDNIVLHIETENRIGDKINIHLEDKTHDFLYNGKVLENDKLSDYIINSNLEKIELEVISQSS